MRPGQPLWRWPPDSEELHCHRRSDSQPLGFSDQRTVVLADQLSDRIAVEFSDQLAFALADQLSDSIAVEFSDHVAFALPDGLPHIRANTCADLRAQLPALRPW